MISAAHGTGILYFVGVAAVHAHVVGDVDGEIGNVLIHGVVHQGFQAVDIVLDGGIQLHVSDASGGGEAGKLGFQVDFREGIQAAPDGNVHAVCEKFPVTDIGNDAVGFPESLHGGVAQVLCRGL